MKIKFIRNIRLLNLVPSLLLSGCLGTITSNSFPPTASPSTSFDAQGRQLIGPGDELSIRVMGQQDLSGSYRVSPAGEIYMPLLGAVPVMGQTAEGVKSSLATGLRKFIKSPNVSAAISQFVSQKIYFVGEWNKPGPQSFDTPVTLLEAIGSAGNLSRFASGRIVLIRNANTESRERYATTLKAVLNGRDDADKATLRRGDVLVAE
jgi:polysaccharide export outer membrane protein